MHLSFRRERLRSLGCKTKSRSKKILRIDDIKNEIESNYNVAGSAVLYLKLYAKRKTATALATTKQPYLSLEADRASLNAQEELSRAQSSISSTSEEEESVQRLRKVVNDIEAHRKNMRVSGP